MPPHIYVEQTLQLTAVRWLREHRGYSELLSDDMAVGDGVDSVGLMEDRILLVEVKPVVHVGDVRHAGDRPGTIGSKVPGVLRGVQGKEQDRVSRAVLANWNPVRPPVVAMLAARYTPAGLQDLEELLRTRSEQWLFDYRVWRWTGSRVEELERHDMAPPPCPTAYSALSIEKLIGRRERARPRSVDELRSLAKARGVGGLLDHALHVAGDLGFRRITTRSNINLLRPTLAGKWENVVGFYILGSASEVGLNVGIWREKLDLDERDLPGRPAPRMGFLNTNRYVQTAEDLTYLLNLFCSPAGLSG